MPDVLTSARPYKLTPSSLTFLYDECPRCFWRTMRLGKRRPSGPFPSVFNRYHDLLQRFFFGKDTRLLSPTLPGGVVTHGETWLQSDTLHVGGGACYLRGRCDNLLRFDDGTWGLVDYKTAAPSERSRALYRRQLHAYAWAFERAAPGSPHVYPITRMGLLVLDPQRVRAFRSDRSLLAELRPTWQEIERDDAWFEGFLADVVALLEGEAPRADEKCAYCTWANVPK